MSETKRHHVFAVNLDGDGVTSDLPKDEDGNVAATSDTWIEVLAWSQVKKLMKQERVATLKEVEKVVENFRQRDFNNEHCNCIDIDTLKERLRKESE